ncbi:type I secretion outer membrane protein, TolC family [Magnetococcus marinus MC-1]|uniref:Type I secretion outer membrane protein, TolC family n=1 Tax=Magnetococcus marinus (strain ATCC BAA-1437 / JCM 17883 / MC-1) TaxID=156889 RepID=A0L528_MAGMM|nr:TolC family outer membrane protein [Magnetococcus marinus]ABK43071.1 type I secretion outer membrane protein, TolC family [Magnetococcus marinus MC-1]
MLKHRSTQLLTLLSLTWGMGSAWAQEGAPLTLQDAVLKALSSNPEVLASWENKQANTQLVRQARAGYFPTLDLAAGYGKEVTDNTTTRAANKGTTTMNRGESSATVSQKLFDGLSTYTNVKRAKASDQSSLHAFDRTAEKVGRQAMEAFMERAKQQQILALTAENVQDHEETLKKLKALAAGGQGKKADVQQTESRLFSAKDTLVQAKGKINIAGATYERVIGESPGMLATPALPKENLPETLDQALEIAAQMHPLLLGSQQDLNAATFAKLKSRSSFMPSITLDLTASNNGNVSGTRGYAQAMSAMLNMKYNIFNGGSDLAAYRESDHRINQTRETLSLNQRTVREQVITAWEQMEMAKHSVALVEKQVKAQQDTVKSYLQEFELDKRTHLDVLNAKNELYRARVQQVSGNFDYIMRVYQLWSAMGVMRENMGLHQTPVMAKH